MLELPEVTLICLTGKNYKEHHDALRKSCEGISWGAVKAIWTVGRNTPLDTNRAPWLVTDGVEVHLSDLEVKNIDDWNHAIVYDLHRYVDTPYALLIHADGYVINPRAWRREFLDYDYVGAPWPLPQDEYSYRTPRGELVRVGNSVSLRSKLLLTLPSTLDLPWKSYYGNTNEDGFLCVHNRDELIRRGVAFAPLDVAKYFSKEHEIEENKGIETFAFHQVDI